MIRDAVPAAGKDASEKLSEALGEIAAKNRSEMQKLEAANGLTEEEQRKYAYPIAFVTSLQQKIRLEHPDSGASAFELIRGDYQRRVRAMQAHQAVYR